MSAGARPTAPTWIVVRADDTSWLVARYMGDPEGCHYEPIATCRCRGAALDVRDALDEQAVRPPSCGHQIAGTQNRCTRDMHHGGDCRCSAGDVDDRAAGRATA